MLLLQDHVTRKADHYREAFLTAKPYKHVIIDNFYTEEALSGFLDEFPSHGATRDIVGDYNTKNAKKGGRSDVKTFGPTYQAWDQFIQTDGFLSLLSRITGIEHLLYDSEYIGAGIHENFAGHRGNVHIDYNFHPSTGFHRRLNAICYITPEWKASYGGGLKVMENGRNPQAGFRKVVPCLSNRCILFETTEKSWHGVESIQLPPELEALTRKSITTYFYTRQRPENETAPRHSTIYYPGELSEDFEEGYTLNDFDVREINNFQRRANALITNLYKEHSRLYQITTRLRRKIAQQEQKISRLNECTEKNIST